MIDDPEFLELIRCPESRQAVTVADEATLAALNGRIREGGVVTRGGTAVEKEVDAGLVREDGRVLYPIDDGIPVLLVEESIELS